MNRRTIVLIIAAGAAFLVSLIAYPNPRETAEQEYVSSGSENQPDQNKQESDKNIYFDSEQSEKEDTERSSDTDYPDKHISLDADKTIVAVDPYLPTVESKDDPTYIFPCNAPESSTADLVASYAENFFPYETDYICSYNATDIDGKTLEFYEFYDETNLAILCIVAKDSDNNYQLYDVVKNSYTPIIVD